MVLSAWFVKLCWVAVRVRVGRCHKSNPTVSTAHNACYDSHAAYQLTSHHITLSSHLFPLTTLLSWQTRIQHNHLQAHIPALAVACLCAYGTDLRSNFTTAFVLSGWPSARST